MISEPIVVPADLNTLLMPQRSKELFKSRSKLAFAGVSKNSSRSSADIVHNIHCMIICMHWSDAFVPFHTQFGLTPLLIGLLYLPYGVIDIPLAMVFGRLSDKFVSVQILNYYRTLHKKYCMLI